jgi:L-lactate dehydrogenase
VPLLKCKAAMDIDLVSEARKSAKKAYSIITAKGYTAFGVGRAIEEIVYCILTDQKRTLPVSVRVPEKNCCLSLPCIVGFRGVERILTNVTQYFSDWEKKMYGASIRAMQAAVGSEVDDEDTSLASAEPPVFAAAAETPITSLVSSRLHAKPVHVAVVGAGFVGTNTAFALIEGRIASKVTLTDVNTAKCDGEVLDLEDGDGRIEMATPPEAGQADVIVITAGRGQKEGETRLDLVNANAAIMRSVIEGMKPLNPTAKIIVVSNPCDALTFVAQECSGLPPSQVFGSGTVLDTRRLRIEMARQTGVSFQSVHSFVLGEHGDSQFAAASLATIGGVPIGEWGVDVEALLKVSSTKAYNIISKKGYTAFGVAVAVQSIVDAVVHDALQIFPVSVRVPGRRCCLSLPCVVGADGVHSILSDVVEHFSAEEKEKYDASLAAMEAAVAAAGF